LDLIWPTLAKLIGLCFLEELSSLLIAEERLGKTVRLVFGLVFIAILLDPMWRLLKLGDILADLQLEGLVE
jgi:hypothetical protein